MFTMMGDLAAFDEKSKQASREGRQRSLCGGKRKPSAGKGRINRHFSARLPAFCIDGFAGVPIDVPPLF